MPEVKTLSFTGLKPHKLPFGFNEGNPACSSLKIALKKRLIELIEGENVKNFISSMAMGIDMICAELVLELRADFPDITLEAAVEHKEQALLWPEEYRERYRNLLECCDRVHVISEKYKDGCKEKRNRYMIDKSDLILAVWDGETGGTGDFAEYAKKRKKPIVVIDPNQPLTD